MNHSNILLKYKHLPTGLYYKSLDRKPTGVNLGEHGELYGRKLPFPLLEVIVVQAQPEHIVTTQPNDWLVEEYDIVEKGSVPLANSKYFAPSSNVNFNRYAIGARTKITRKFQIKHGGVKGVRVDGEEKVFPNLQQAADWLNRYTGKAHKGTIQKAIVGKRATADGTMWAYLPKVEHV